MRFFTVHWTPKEENLEHNFPRGSKIISARQRFSLWNVIFPHQPFTIQYHPTTSLTLIQSQAPEQTGASESGFQSFGSRQRQRGSQLASQQVSRGGSQVSRGSQQTLRGSQSGVDDLRGSLGTRADLLSQVGPFDAFLHILWEKVLTIWTTTIWTIADEEGGKQYLILVTTDFFKPVHFLA